MFIGGSPSPRPRFDGYPFLSTSGSEMPHAFIEGKMPHHDAVKPPII